MADPGDGLLILLYIVISITVLICFFNMVMNVAKIKKCQIAQLKLQIEIAEKQGVGDEEIDAIKTICNNI